MKLESREATAGLRDRGLTAERHICAAAAKGMRFETPRCQLTWDMLDQDRAAFSGAGPSRPSVEDSIPACLRVVSSLDLLEAHLLIEMTRALIPGRSPKCPSLRQWELPNHEIHSLRPDTLVLKIRVDENATDLILSNGAGKHDKTTHYLIIHQDLVVPTCSHHSSLPAG